MTYSTLYFSLNSLWLCDASLRRISCSQLVRVRTYRLRGTKPLMGSTVSWTLRHKRLWSFNQDGDVFIPWWRHQMETFSALLAICAGNSSVPGEFTAQRPVTRSFDVFFDLRLNKRLSKRSWGGWFETLSRPLWRHCNAKKKYISKCPLQDDDQFVPASNEILQIVVIKQHGLT